VLFIKNRQPSKVLRWDSKLCKSKPENRQSQNHRRQQHIAACRKSAPERNDSGTKITRSRIEDFIMPTVLLADSCTLLRDTIRNLFNDHPEIQLIGEAKSFEETAQLAKKLL